MLRFHWWLTCLPNKEWLCVVHMHVHFQSWTLCDCCCEGAQISLLDMWEIKKSMANLKLNQQKYVEHVAGCLCALGSKDLNLTGKHTNSKIPRCGGWLAISGSCKILPGHLSCGHAASKMQGCRLGNYPAESAGHVPGIYRPSPDTLYMPCRCPCGYFFPGGVPTDHL